MNARAFSVRSSVLADFRQFALTVGLEPIGLMARVGISRHYLDDPDLKLPMSAVVDLLEVAAHASGLSDFGIRFGEMRGLPDLGPIILLLREETDVRTALNNFTAMLHLHSDALLLSLDEHGPDPILLVDILGRNIGSRRQAIETSASGAVAILRWLLGPEWNPALVSFRHDRPASTIKHEQLFRAPLQFSADINGIVLNPYDLQRPLRPSSAAFRRQVERVVASFAQSSIETYVANVSHVIAVLMPHGDATAANTARLLGISSRTLHRKLAAADTNFSMVLDQVRRDRAGQCMRNRSQSFTDISTQLGFGSLSAFSRWYAQTYDCSPSQARRAEESREDA